MGYEEFRQKTTIRQAVATQVDKSSEDVTDEDFQVLLSLTLSKENPRDELEKCLNLEDLSIESVTKEDTEKITQLKKLKSLELIADDLADEGDLDFLKELPELECLYLNIGFIFNTEPLKALENLKELEIISVEGRSPNGGYLSVADLPETLCGLRIKADYFDCYNANLWENLQFLDMCGSSPSPMESIVFWHSLRQLVISGRLIDDESRYEKFKILLSFSRVLSKLQCITIDNTYGDIDINKVKSELLEARSTLKIDVMEGDDDDSVSLDDLLNGNVEINMGEIRI
jgi:hypothetical protein